MPKKGNRKIRRQAVLIYIIGWSFYIRKRKFEVGDKVKVKVIRADKDKSEIDFEIYDDEITR